MSYRIDESGRRPSDLLLIDRLRADVDRWRENDYPGASEVTDRLFKYWFEEDHDIPGFPTPFRYHFCQREAIETLAYVVEIADFRLSGTKPFQWRRNLPPLECKWTVFNYVATYNDFERRFAEFLDDAPDVVRFASLGTTEQGESGARFRVDYFKPSGAIGFCYPDWVVVEADTGRRDQLDHRDKGPDLGGHGGESSGDDALV